MIKHFCRPGEGPEPGVEADHVEHADVWLEGAAGGPSLVGGEEEGGHVGLVLGRGGRGTAAPGAHDRQAPAALDEGERELEGGPRRAGDLHPRLAEEGRVGEDPLPDQFGVDPVKGVRARAAAGAVDAPEVEAVKAPGGPVALGPRGGLLQKLAAFFGVAAEALDEVPAAREAAIVPHEGTHRGIGGPADDEEVAFPAVPAAVRANDQGLEGPVRGRHAPRVSGTRDRGGQSFVRDSSACLVPPA